MAPDRFSTEGMVRVNDGQKGVESEQTRGGESKKYNPETKETGNPDKLVLFLSKCYIHDVGSKQVSQILLFLAVILGGESD